MRTAPIGKRVFAWVLFTVSPVFGQMVTQGTVALGGGGALLDGDRPAFQEIFRQRKDGIGGLEDFKVTQTSDTSLFRFEVTALPPDEDYRALVRFEKFDVFYAEAGYRNFRTYYDGSGGRFLPRNLALSYFNESLALDRAAFYFELGTLLPDRIQWRLRYDRSTRSGTKNSLRWGDSDLPGVGFGARGLIPAYLVVDEDREAVTVEAGQSTTAANWKVAGRGERTHVRNRHVARRNAAEPGDRYDVTRQGARSDALSGHGFYERVFSEDFRVSAGGLATTIDTNLTGSRVYGGTPDATFSPTFAGRQNADNGFYGLTGHAWLRQYLGNANAYYQATRHLSIIAGLKYERLRLFSDEDHFDFDTDQVRPPGGRGPPTLVTSSDSVTGSSRDLWNELTEDLELRYTRWTSLHLSFRGQLSQGTGSLVEASTIVGNRAPSIDRDSDYHRLAQRYDATATWYLRPGLTVGAQYAYRLKSSDQDARRDNTQNTSASGNRYPFFIVDSQLESHDASLRVAWRPRANLSLVSRYAHQFATTTTTFAGLPAIRNGRLTRHVITQTGTWNATPRLYFTGAVNVTYDQLALPPNRLTFNSDNNYVTASVASGYALGKVTDVFVDLSHYRADNYTDNPAVTLPLNQGQTLQSAFVTWVRRQNEHLTYTVKCGCAVNRDGTFGGQNDFTARLVYAKVQYKF